MNNIPIRDRIARGSRTKAQRITLTEMRELRTAVWDIEAGGLDANYDVMLCASIKGLEDDNLTTFKIGKCLWDDSKLVSKVRGEIEKYDVLVHHYGDRFDIPFLNTRLLINNLPLLDTRDMVFVDTWWVARHQYKFNSNRLATLIAGLGTPTSKTPLDGLKWIAAKAGHRPSLQYIIDHNKADVLALEEVVIRLAKANALKYSYRK